tara:strand:+ start:29179 stop:29553 length:375 start_codon:yes stop_codon:yes gene_type:complete
MSELVKSKPETLVEKVLYLKKLCYKDVQKPSKEDSLNEENSLICLAETMLKTLLNDLNISIENTTKDNQQKLKLINLYLNTFEKEVLGSKSFEGNNVTIENLILHLDSIITRMEIRTTSWCVIS